MRSGVLFLACSYSRRSWRVLLALAEGVSWGVLSPLSWWTRLFGFGEPLVPAFGSLWVFGAAFLPGPAALEGFLLRWARPGRGKENFRVLLPPAQAGLLSSAPLGRLGQTWVLVVSVPVYAGNQQAARPGRLLEVFSGCRLRRERLFGGLSYSKQERFPVRDHVPQVGPNRPRTFMESFPGPWKFTVPYIS